MKKWPNLGNFQNGPESFASIHRDRSVGVIDRGIYDLHASVERSRNFKSVFRGTKSLTTMMMLASGSIRRSLRAEKRDEDRF